MAGDVWQAARKRLRAVLVQWHQARMLDIPRDPAREHAYRKALLQLEIPAQNQIDRLCRDWFAGRRLRISRMNPDNACLVYDRFAEAEGFCASCCDNPPVAATTVADALTFLLIEHWAADGAASWRARLDE
jgi:hypothetical protein